MWTFVAAVCSIMEGDSAKLNGAVSAPNPRTVGCSELDLEQAGLVITYSLYVKPISFQSAACTC